jgi:hypothetical protein
MQINGKWHFLGAKISKLTVQDLEEVEGANKDHLNENTQGLLKAI